MPKARKHQVSLDVTPYYHCVSRCVRRAFLCGIDAFTSKSYEHRRQWIEDRILYLAQIFAIDVCAFAVMSNHYHVLLHINKDKSDSWSDREICKRWHKLFKGTALTQQYIANGILTNSELATVNAKLKEWRQHLSDISWFMRLVNEPIARQANLEDECKGKFWEARFKSQALCDEKALAACMAYIDLNPIRAKAAKNLESSNHTSIKLRLDAVKNNNMQPPSLAKFSTDLPFRLKEYIDLVTWTERTIFDSPVKANTTTPPILDRLEIDLQQWSYLTTKFESRFKTLVGAAQNLRKAAQKLGYKRTPNIAHCKAAFG